MPRSGRLPCRSRPGQLDCSGGTGGSAVAAWAGRGANRRLSTGGNLPWCHQLDRAAYDQVRDVHDYNKG
jgi:hypothetical protein